VFHVVTAKRDHQWTSASANNAWIEAHEVGLALNMRWVLLIENVHTLRVDYEQADRLLLSRPDDSLVDVMIAKTVADYHQPRAAQ